MKRSGKPILSISQILSDKISRRIETAYRFVELAHKGRKRFSGKAYLHHVVSSADILLGWLDTKNLTAGLEDIVIATLLHDVIEYEGVSPKSIQKKFGSTVKNLVLGVSDLRSDGTDKTEVENLKYIARKGYLDPKVFVIKLADRLHNMRTHQFLPKEKQIPKAQETMNVYVPLAEEMGMWLVKKELEDICFSYLAPQVYKSLEKQLQADPRMTKSFDNKYKKELDRILDNENVQINFNSNGLFTIHTKKLKAQNLGLEEDLGFSKIDDVKTIGIILDSTEPTKLYSILGKIHNSKAFLSLVEPKKINDYIARPRPNKFSAIQTVLNLPEGKTEIIITTAAKKEFNDLGIISLIKNGSDLSEYKRNIIFDSEKNAWFMPVGTTYMDYVFKIGVGVFAKGVVVNGTKKSLDKKVRNGSVVKIVLSGSKNLHQSAINSKIMEVTKLKIETQINLHKRDMLIIKGRKMIEQVLSGRGLLNLNDVASIRNLIVHTLLLADTNELCFRIGIGNVSKKQIEKVLDINGITKTSLGLSTIRVTGSDKPGLLNEVTKILMELGGNIIHVAFPRPIERKKNRVTFRILFKGLDSKDLLALKDKVTKTNNFTKVEVV